MSFTVARAFQSWQYCTELLGKSDLPTKEKIAEAANQFKEALSVGERALTQDLDGDTQAQVDSLVSLLRQFTNGLGDINKNQTALAYCIRGFIAGTQVRQSFAVLANMDKESLDEFGTMQIEAAIDTLEQDGLPAYEKALQLKPDYTAAQIGLEEDREYLRGLKRDFAPLLSSNNDRQTIETAARLITESNRTLDWCTSDHKDWQGVIIKTSKHIDEIEAFLEGVSRDSIGKEAYRLLEYGLSALYFQRANSIWVTAVLQKPKDKNALKSAQQDLQKASSYPDACYTVAGKDPYAMRQYQAELKERIDKELSSCFIATAAYGSALAPEIVTLRSFRDLKLKPNRFGRWLINVYEQFSPPLADWIASRPKIRFWIQRWLLEPVIWFVRQWMA